MRTIRTKVYKFNELSETAKEKAIDNYRNRDNSYNVQYLYDEIIDSAKAVANLFDLKFGREYTDIRYEHIDDNILALSGIRLYKFIVNNYYNELFTPKYIKSIDKEVRYNQFICKVKTGKNGKYTQLYSKLRISDDGCPLTGVCYDYDILQPVYDFLKKPNKSENFEDLIKSIEHAISKTFIDTDEWVNSDEFIKDELINNEYEFTKDGNLFS